jgi:hypothetical protein
MIGFSYKVGEDSFGLYIQTESYNDLDELDDYFVENQSLIPKGMMERSPYSEGCFRLYFNKSIGLAKLTKIMDNAVLRSSHSGS